ncbi:MAG: phosphoglycolate phosphatase [Pseudomonadota bacterium]
MAAFDLDGTLVDSVPDLAWAGDEMLNRLGLPRRGEESARLFVGNGMEQFVKRMLTGEMNAEPDATILQSAVSLYKQIYADNICNKSRLYPGVLEGLEYLKVSEVKLACITNKASAFAEALLEQIGLSRYFDLVVGGDTLPKRKPHPLPLQHAAQSLNAPASRCVMVGDSKNDVMAALAAGFKVVCVPYGYNHGDDIRRTKPDAVIDSLAELSTLFTVPTH